MMNRRLLLSIFAAGFAAAFAPRVKAAPIAPLSTVIDPDVVWVMGWDDKPRAPAFEVVFPRGSTNSFGYISTGSEWVPVDSAQGRMIEAEGGRGFPFPRGTLVPMALCVKDGEVRLNLNAPCVEQISTGSELIPLESPEGQAVLNSMAADHAGQSRW